MPGFDTLSVKNMDQVHTFISFDGQNTETSQEGEPAIPGYSLFVGVPPKGDVIVNFVAEQIKTVRLNNPIGVNKNIPKDNQPGMDFKAPWVSEPFYVQLGKIRTARIVIRPFIYDKGSNTLRVLTKGYCTVSIPSSANRITTAEPVRSDYDRMLSSLICNYKVASGWYSANNLQKRAAEKFPFSFRDKVYRFKIGDGHSGTNETTINENGIVKIPGSKIIELFGKVSVSKISLFASVKGELPDTVSAEGLIPDGVVEVPLLMFDRNGNNTVDKDDYFLTHVSGASDWVYNQWRQDFSFRLNRYDDYRNYWLTVTQTDGRKMATFTPVTGAVDTLNSFENRILYKRSLEQPAGSEGGLEWVWSKLSLANPAFFINFDLPGLDTLGGLSVKVITQPPVSGGKFSISLGQKSYPDCISNEPYFFKNISNGNFRISFGDISGNVSSAVEIKEIQATYTRELKADSSSSYTVFSPPTPGPHLYSLRLLTNDPVYVFRLSEDQNQISLVDSVRNGRGSMVNWTDSGENGIRYFVCAERAFLTLPELQQISDVPNSRYTVSDLRNIRNKTDYIIITHSDFLSQAQDLAAHKASVGFTPVVVRVGDVYRYFSGGNTDPSAIRNFVTYVKRSWDNDKDPSYVTLLGSGHYDNKGFKSTPPFIPVYYYGERLIEDYFTYTVPGSFPQLALGRIPCTTPQEASAVIDKIRETEDPELADFGEWRNRTLFVADDDMQGDKIDPIVSMTPHHVSSDRVGGVVESRWPYIDMRKVYLYDYEWNSAWEKPEASRAIINEINNGVGFVNYFGHGSDILWADEHVLRVENVSSMHNSGKYPVITSFSCSVGKFDNPEVECLSEALVNASKAGAVAAISSARLAYANANENLATAFYGAFFDTLLNAGDTSTIGMALVKAKITGSAESHRTYSVLGDPSIRHMKRSGKIELSIKNSKNEIIDTIKALQRITVSGSIRKNDGNLLSGFGSSGNPAYIQIGLFNSPDSAMRKDGGANTNLRYFLPGTPVFLGKTQIRDGKFQQTILVPRNISFDKPGVKLTGYAWGEGKDGVALGVLKNIVFHGTEKSSASKDSSGPLITIRPVYDTPEMSAVGASFTKAIVSLLPLKCEIDFFDESGIDASGTGPDEGLTMEVAGTLSKRNINHKFQFREGDYRRGSATIVFEENTIKTGQHTIAITARDLFGNISSRNFTLVVTDQTELRLDQVFNYPNPMRMGKNTRFYFYPSNTAQQFNQMSVKAAIKIYTLGGRVVRVFKDARNGEVWDGRDQAGNVLSPDIYLYQVVATSPVIQKTVKSKIKKLVIHPPR